jgi:hypothetical protein
VRLVGLSGAELVGLASPCCIGDVIVVVSDGGVALSKKSVSAMTLQQVRECISGVLVDERLKVCNQDTYVCYRCSRWLIRTQEAIKNCKNQQNR